jgi:hypothetical protein
VPSEGQRPPSAERLDVPRRISFAALGVLLPGGVFFLAYLYERGYTNTFSIDPDYIAIDASAIAAVGLDVFARLYVLIALLVHTVLWGISPTFDARGRGRRLLYVLFEAVAVGTLVYLLIWEFAADRLATAGIRFVGYMVISLAIVGVYLFLERIDQPGIGSALDRVIESGYSWALAGAVILGLAAYWSGQADAAHQTRFEVLKRDESLVLLRQYGDRAIAGRIAAPGTLANSRIVLTLGPSPPATQEFVSREVGPLTVAP